MVTRPWIPYQEFPCIHCPRHNPPSGLAEAGMGAPRSCPGEGQVEGQGRRRQSQGEGGGVVGLGASANTRVATSYALGLQAAGRAPRSAVIAARAFQVSLSHLALQRTKRCHKHNKSEVCADFLDPWTPLPGARSAPGVAPEAPPEGPAPIQDIRADLGVVMFMSYWFSRFVHCISVPRFSSKLLLAPGRSNSQDI